MLDIDPIKARLAAATPGPWRVVKKRPRKWQVRLAVVDDNLLIAPPDEVPCTWPEHDADFIANAPADLAALVAEVERLRAYSKKSGNMTAEIDSAYAEIRDLRAAIEAHAKAWDTRNPLLMGRGNEKLWESVGLREALE